MSRRCASRIGVGNSQCDDSRGFSSLQCDVYRSKPSGFVCLSPQTAERRFAILFIRNNAAKYREFALKTTLTFACLTLMLGGCATLTTSYTPAADQLAEYDQGVGSVRWETAEAVV